MSGNREVTYALDLPAITQGRGRGKKQPPDTGTAVPAAFSRIARLLALAIRFERLVREEHIPDYAEMARRGRVTRARMTQIMKLLHLAPDIQKQILFLPPVAGLNERNLRPVVNRIDWDEQRRMFEKITGLVGFSRDPNIKDLPVPETGVMNVIAPAEARRKGN